MTAGDQELTPAEAGELLGVDEQTARRWFDQGLLAGYRTRPGRGGHRRIYRSSVEAFDRRRRTGPGDAESAPARHPEG